MKDMKLKIYTKTGDLGQTSLYGGKRVWKNDLTIEACGNIDELNSVLGLLRSELKGTENQVDFDELVEEVQKKLFVIGAKIAGFSEKEKTSFKTEGLEKFIDRLEKDLPELKNFILPDGNKTATLFHLARSVCRRAERKAVELSQKQEIDTNIIIYLNRLSDLLFEMARYTNWKNGVEETRWII